MPLKCPMSVAARASLPPGSGALLLLRKQLGLTMREVEATSLEIAERRDNKRFLLPPSRLSDIETFGVVPTIYRFYSLAVAYHKDIRTLMSWFGVDVSLAAGDIPLSTPANSHLCDTFTDISAFDAPLPLKHNLGRQGTAHPSEPTHEWGIVPITFLSRLASGHYAYGYVGKKDLMMYPLIPPGSLVQVDESKCRIQKGQWKSEYERPIYLVETRGGSTCCWCTLNAGEIILQPHPLSPCPARALKHPREAEVVGQVVGVATKLGDGGSKRPIQNAVSIPIAHVALPANGVVPQVEDGPIWSQLIQT